MSSSHDLVGIATGDVRVSLKELTLKQRLKLFGAYAQKLRYYYDHLKGGSAFVPWKMENFGEKLTEHSIRRNSLILDESLYPSDKDYNSQTRITALTAHYFRDTEFKEPVKAVWKLGHLKLVVRLCLAQNGDIYLEWYEGKVTSFYVDEPHIPQRVLVSVAKYIKLRPSMIATQYIPDELKKLLTEVPSFLYSFGYSALSLISKEVEERQKRLNRGRALFNELNALGKLFGITQTETL